MDFSTELHRERYRWGRRESNRLRVINIGDGGCCGERMGAFGEDAGRDLVDFPEKM
jgi:hypothetical protein